MIETDVDVIRITLENWELSYYLNWIIFEEVFLLTNQNRHSYHRKY